MNSTIRKETISGNAGLFDDKDGKKTRVIRKTRIPNLKNH